tara:strand:+ start:1043 stop:1507 length:465 start_codon:yes stop_codon:yes gene_type:complete
MKKNFVNIVLLFVLVFLTNCGYSPLLVSNKIDFNIADMSFEGERKINNYIENSLNNQIRPKKSMKSFDLKIKSSFEKTITNKDKSGDPKNYNLKLITSIIAISNNSETASKTFEKNISLSAQNKKIDERELEKKYIKDLSELIGKDIIFFLINQ